MMNRSAPLKIRNQRESRQLCLQWTEETQQLIPHAALRAHCPCSKCRAAKLSGRIPLIPEGVTLTDIHPFPYGVQLVFSDGHDRGIYPWGYLEALQ